MNPLLIGPLADIIAKVVDRILPQDPEKAAAAQLELLKLQQSGELAQLTADTDLAKAQIGVDTEEAKSINWFVAGARPFILWTCGVGLLYAALGEPLARFIATVGFHYTGAFPVLNTDITLQLLFGLLGLGGYRTVEKLKGVEGNR